MTIRFILDISFLFWSNVTEVTGGKFNFLDNWRMRLVHYPLKFTLLRFCSPNYMFSFLLLKNCIIRSTEVTGAKFNILSSIRSNEKFLLS